PGAGGGWSEPLALTPDDGGEVGSSHLADGSEGIAVVWIGRELDPGVPFRPSARWRTNGDWGEVRTLDETGQEAWHTNVERRTDGSVLAGWDLGQGGMENRVLVRRGSAGGWGPLVDLSEGRWWGERPHFAFAEDGTDHVTWFHRTMDQPLRVYTRPMTHTPSGAQLGPVTTLSQGLGGYQYDPDIAVNGNGVLCATWGWDGGSDADLVFSRNQGAGWTSPTRVAAGGQDKPGLPSLVAAPDGTFHVVWVQWRRGVSSVWWASLQP
ncbi:MAG: sialidase family protein, partial [Myxococcota bacterium]|nr:sialidase family protein [Myxococcota bacterium]